jgi:L-threonylcarbamoyladenylate synthase
MSTLSSSKPLVLKCDPKSISFPSSSSPPIISSLTTLESINRASSLLKSSSLVSFPTETVYGLGANALSSSSVSKIFRAKGRPSDNPLIVHISSIEMISTVLGSDWRENESREIGEVRQKLIENFWPGPMTLLFPLPPRLDRGDNTLSPLCTSSLKTVGLRLPSHPIARALISISGLPLAAPSANKSGRPSTTMAQHVFEDYKDDGDSGLVEVILDGGECSVGIESSVIEIVESAEKQIQIRILRAGGLEAERIQSLLGDKATVLIYGRDWKDKKLESNPSTPGMKYKHYSPTNSIVALFRTSESPTASSLESLISLLLPSNPNPLVSFMIPSNSILLSKLSRYPSESFHPPYILGSDPAEIAQRIFSGLRDLDSLERSDGEKGADLILVEAIEEKGLGIGIMERLRKSAGGQKDVWQVRIS